MGWISTFVVIGTASWRINKVAAVGDLCRTIHLLPTLVLHPQSFKFLPEERVSRSLKMTAVWGVYHQIYSFCVFASFCWLLCLVKRNQFTILPEDPEARNNSTMKGFVQTQYNLRFPLNCEVNCVAAMFQSKAIRKGGCDQIKSTVENLESLEFPPGGLMAEANSSCKSWHGGFGEKG